MFFKTVLPAITPLDGAQRHVAFILCSKRPFYTSAPRPYANVLNDNTRGNRSMSNKTSVPHEDRTAAEPRDSYLHSVNINKITQVNDTIRTFRLNITDKQHGVEFLPGQWLDVHFEGLDKAGGYTIISTPQRARAVISTSSDDREPYLELAVQYASTAQVQRLWADEQTVLNMKLLVRVGGSFTWPPAHLRAQAPRRVIFLAGGVGINPLISMVKYMHETNTMPARVDFLYVTRVKSTYSNDNILSLPSLLSISKARPDQFNLQLFLSGHPSRELMETALPRKRFEPRRLLDSDVIALLSDTAMNTETVCYVCGPPNMTDHYVDLMKGQTGMAEERVLCEKWW